MPAGTARWTGWTAPPRARPGLGSRHMAAGRRTCGWVESGICDGRAGAHALVGTHAVRRPHNQGSRARARPTARAPGGASIAGQDGQARQAVAYMSGLRARYIRARPLPPHGKCTHKARRARTQPFCLLGTPALRARARALDWVPDDAGGGRRRGSERAPQPSRVGGRGRRGCGRVPHCPCCRLSASYVSTSPASGAAAGVRKGAGWHARSGGLNLAGWREAGARGRGAPLRGLELVGLLPRALPGYMFSIRPQPSLLTATPRRLSGNRA
jgi:hypothetical protein